tara:strand:+ start:569 stop:1078 length:510 start_codon:yes stop_codon:yes gene_type:complete
MADGTLKVGTITNSAGSGNITIGSGVTVNVNRPSFSAEGTGLTVANSTWTELVGATENFDTDSVYSTSTGRFTVPTGQAGKYFFYYGSGISGNPDDGEKVSVRLYKNGSSISRTLIISYVSANNQTTEIKGSYLLDLAEGDYVSVYMNHTEGASTSDALVSFGGCKIGA